MVEGVTDAVLVGGGVKVRVNVTLAVKVGIGVPLDVTVMVEVMGGTVAEAVRLGNGVKLGSWAIRVTFSVSGLGVCVGATVGVRSPSNACRHAVNPKLKMTNTTGDHFLNLPS